METQKIFLFEKNTHDNPVKYANICVYQIAEVLLAAGCEVEAHVQICDEITYIVSGEAAVYNGSNSVKLKSGDIHIVSKGEIHRIIADKSDNCRYVCFGIEINSDSKKCTELESIFKGEKVISAKSSDELRTLVTMLMNEIYNKADFGEDMIEMLIMQIMIYIYRNRLQSNDSKNRRKFEVEAIYGILRYIDMNLTQIRDIQMISNELSYSKYYISHLFKEKLGITVYEYITERKLDMAKSMLAKGDDISEIAERLNYESTQSFSKMFKRHVGVSPSKYIASADNTTISDTKNNNEESCNK